MKPSLVLAFVSSFAALAACSEEPQPQVSPRAAFATTSEAMASLRSAWEELETRIDASMHEGKQAAQAAISKASGASAARAESDALDDLRSRHAELGLAILRLELLHREALRDAEGSAGALDRASVEARNAERAVAARKRLANGYRDARAAVLRMR